MPRILKAANITVDDDHKINIAVMDPASFMRGADTEQEPEITENAEDVALDIVRKAQVDAKNKKDAAEREAQEILDVARLQAEHMKQEAQEAARATGYGEGYQQALADAEALKRQAQQTLDDAVTERVSMIDAVEPDIIELVTKITAKLLAVEVKTNPQIILSLIKQGLAGGTLTGDVKIHVSAGDYETVTQGKDEIMYGLDTMANLEIIKDMSLHETDCIIETAYGNIDCSLDQQFALLKKDLLYILENR